MYVYMSISQRDMLTLRASVQEVRVHEKAGGGAAGVPPAQMAAPIPRVQKGCPRDSLYVLPLWRPTPCQFRAHVCLALAEVGTSPKQ